jgi:hypothetical protein
VELPLEEHREQTTEAKNCELLDLGVLIKVHSVFSNILDFG